MMIACLIVMLVVQIAFVVISWDDRNPIWPIGFTVGALACLIGLVAMIQEAMK